VARIPDVERRAAVEVRAARGRRLAGYAAVWDAPAQIGSFVEVIKAGAMRASLVAGADILALVDHDPCRLLGRTRSGTLWLDEDAKGLAFEIDLPDTQLGRDVHALASRGDVGGMSFAMRVTDEAWPARDRREVRSVDLVEISVVQAHPAYAQTTVEARARPAPFCAAWHARRRFVDML
jgi:HK97 family phage prohead protease